MRLKLHWVPFHLPSSVVGTALKPYGNVQDVARDTLRFPGLQGVEFTTRLLRLTLKNGVTLDSERCYLGQRTAQAIGARGGGAGKYGLGRSAGPSAVVPEVQGNRP